MRTVQLGLDWRQTLQHFLTQSTVWKPTGQAQFPDLPSSKINNHLQMPIGVRLTYWRVFHSNCPTTETTPFWKYCPGTGQYTSFWEFLQLNPVSTIDKSKALQRVMPTAAEGGIWPTPNHKPLTDEKRKQKEFITRLDLHGCNGLLCRGYPSNPGTFYLGRKEATSGFLATSF